MVSKFSDNYCSSLETEMSEFVNHFGLSEQVTYLWAIGKSKRKYLVRSVECNCMCNALRKGKSRSAKRTIGSIDESVWLVYFEWKKITSEKHFSINRNVQTIHVKFTSWESWSPNVLHWMHTVHVFLYHTNVILTVLLFFSSSVCYAVALRATASRFPPATLLHRPGTAFVPSSSRSCTFCLLHARSRPSYPHPVLPRSSCGSSLPLTLLTHTRPSSLLVGPLPRPTLHCISSPPPLRFVVATTAPALSSRHVRTVPTNRRRRCRHVTKTLTHLTVSPRLVGLSLFVHHIHLQVALHTHRRLYL